MEKVKLAVLVSGGGTNLQAILDAQNNGIITDAKVKIVISNNSDAYALIRAKKFGVDTRVIEKKGISQEKFESEIISLLQNYGIDLIILAGFMCILSENFTSKYKERIINVHPSLIPKFCGKGFYGLKVHQAVLESGDKETGATVHFVNEIPDGGKIIAQEKVQVIEGDTPETLQKRVMEKVEWKILPRAIQLVAKKIKGELL